MTDAGTARMELLLDSATVAPPAGAACVRATVHMPEELAAMLEGLHVTDDTPAGARRVSVVAAEVPL